MFLRITFMLFMIFVSFETYSCVLTNATRHINSDGTMGGLVNFEAKVAPSAYLSPEAKVCGKAVVEDNVLIFDSVMIKENAWIRSYTEISGQSVVGGNAVTLGAKSSKVIIKDSSQVFGDAKILSGSIISESSIIEGFAEIQDVKTFGNARVCGSYKLRNVDVFDDLYCLEGIRATSGLVELVNFSEDSLNTPRSILSLRLNDLKFNRNKSVFQIHINDELVPLDNLLINSSILRIMNIDNWKDGVNIVTIVGRDEHEKIISQNFSFYIGTMSHEIVIPNVERNTKFKIYYRIGSQKYKSPFRFEGNKIILEGIPSSLSLDEILIQGVSSNSFIQEKYNLASLPSEVSMTELPRFLDNEPTYDNFFERWNVNHPEFVSVLEINGIKKFQIFESPTSRVEISKTFKLTGEQTGLSFNFSFPFIDNTVLITGPKVEIFYVSRVDKRIESFIIEKGSNIGQPSNINFGFHRKWLGEVTLVVRVSSTDGFHNYESAIDGSEGKIENVTISFEPKNFGSRNPNTRPSDKLIPPTTPITSISKEDCKDQIYNLGTKSSTYHEILTAAPPNLQYFSVGPLNTMNTYIGENRVHGTIRVSGIHKDKIKDIELIGMQGTNKIFTQSWSTCAKEGLAIGGGEEDSEEKPRKESNDPENTSYIFEAQNNLVKFAFAIPFSEISHNQITRTSGSTINFKIKLKYLDGSIEKPVETNVIGIYPILVSPLIPFSQTTGAGGIDTYDSNGMNYTRTGGDKWSLPAYSEKIVALLALNLNWNLNDFAKLNGGTFKPHSGHLNGRDADIKYDPINGYKHNFFCNKSNDQWKNSLQVIENFLINSLVQFGNIEKIFISREGTPSSALACKDADGAGKVQKAFDSKYVERRFNYTCIGAEDQMYKYGKYIDLRDNSGMESSLLVHYGGHHDHLHVEYKELESNRLPPKELVFPSNLDVTHFQYTIDIANKTFRVEPLPEFSETYASSMILARIQNGTDFTDPDNVAIFGKWRPGSTYSEKWNSEFRPFGNKYLYLVEVDRDTGGCRGMNKPIVLDFWPESNSSRKVYKFQALKNGKMKVYE